MTDEERRLREHLGDDLGETVFERACLIWADRVPWERALDQAEAMATKREPMHHGTPSKAPGNTAIP